MRITDPGDEGQESNGFRSSGSNILNSIKTNSVVNKETVTDVPKITATVDSSKLKSMLAGLKRAD
jgi:hypothetical protein